MGINSLVLLLIVPSACRSLQVTIVLKPDVGTVSGLVQFLVSIEPQNGITFISWTVNGSTILTSDGTSNMIDPDYKERVNFSFTTGSLDLKSLTLYDSGSYQITVKASGVLQATKQVNLKVLEGGVQNGLSGGAIAGIVIGVLLALGLFPAGFFIMKKLRPGTSPQSSASNPASQNSAKQQMEMTYAEVNHAKPNGGAVQQGHQSSQANQIPPASPVNESSTTIYSQVKTNR